MIDLIYQVTGTASVLVGVVAGLAGRQAIAKLDERRHHGHGRAKGGKR